MQKNTLKNYAMLFVHIVAVVRLYNACVNESTITDTVLNKVTLTIMDSLMFFLISDIFSILSLKVEKRTIFILSQIYFNKN